MRFIKHSIKTIILLVIVFSCTNNSDTTKEEELSELNSLQNEIELLIDESVCTENSECEFIAFGSKPCGGPWSYLVFSTNIDTELLLNKVAIYNEKENAFNIKWDVVSDCMYVLPPSNTECVDGKCKAIYN